MQLQRLTVQTITSIILMGEYMYIHVASGSGNTDTAYLKVKAGGFLWRQHQQVECGFVIHVQNVYTWQSCVEIERYSVAFFECISVFIFFECISVFIFFECISVFILCYISLNIH